MGQRSRQPAIIGQQQQPFGVDVEAAHRHHARHGGWQGIEHGGAPFGIVGGRHQPGRLVIHPQSRVRSRPAIFWPSTLISSLGRHSAPPISARGHSPQHAPSQSDPPPRGGNRRRAGQHLGDALGPVGRRQRSLGCGLRRLWPRPRGLRCRSRSESGAPACLAKPSPGAAFGRSRRSLPPPCRAAGGLSGAHPCRSGHAGRPHRP